MARDRSRGTEGSLLTLVLLILVCGSCLVYLAKTRDGVPTGALDLNAATADQLAVTLEIDPALATMLIQARQRLGSFDSVQRLRNLTLFPQAEQARAVLKQGLRDVNTADWREFARVLDVSRPVASRIVAYRDSLPGHAFRRPEDAASVPLVDPRTLDALGPQLYVRHPARVFWQLLVYGIITAFLFMLAPILLGRRVRGDPYLLPFAFLLSGLGALVLFSAKDPLRDMPLYTHHLYGVWMGLGAMLFGAFLPVRTRRNLRHYTYVWALFSILLLVALRLVGSGPSGVRLNLHLGILPDIQPIEIVKLLLVLFIAGYLTARGDLLADALHRWRPPLPKGWAAKWGVALPRWQDLGPIVGMYLLALVLFLIVRDMGPALLLFGAFLCTLYVATGRAGILWAGCAMMVIGGFAAYWLHIGVLPVRVDMWLAPWNNTHRLGMQLGQSYWAMASGGEEGSGLGLGALAVPNAIPVVESDLIFAGIGEELGLIGGLTLLILYVLLVWRGMRIALHTQNDFDRLLAIGLTTLLGCQTFIILAGVTGLLPLTGITLPFVARGNTSLITAFLLIGLLRGISAPTTSGSVPLGAQKPVLRRTARQFVTATAFGLMGLIGVGRLFWIQAIVADQTAGHAIRTPDADRVVRSKINPRLHVVERSIPRGTIYDRKGRVLATSRLAEISSAMENDTPEKARHLFLRGVRYYPHGAPCAHILGYVDPAMGGPVGLEKDYNHALRGFDDYSDLLSDYRNQNLPGYRPRKGRDLALTLDADMQEVAYRTLRQRVATLIDRRTGTPKYSAALVVLDPLNGEVLASVSLPAFDPNGMTPEQWRKIQADTDHTHTLLDRARYGFYPPGSTLKVATAGAGMEAGLDPEYDCNHTAFNLRWTFGGQVYGRRELSDDVHDKAAHNHIRMSRALRVSCNLYFAHLGLILGPERLYHAFADRDRWDLGHVRPIAQFAEDLPLNAFGQGTMLTSCTEMARIAAAVANRGAMMQPIYWKELREARGAAVQTNAPSVLSRPLSEANAAKLAEMMHGVVTDGTARGVFDGLPIHIAGKTGTAQTESGDGEPHSWFIGYAPYEHPQIAFACVIENGGYGKQGAAPVIRDLLQKLYGH